MVEFKIGTKLLREAVFLLQLPLFKWNMGWKSPDLNDSHQASVKHTVKLYGESKKKKIKNQVNLCHICGIWRWNGCKRSNQSPRRLYLYLGFITVKMSKWACSPFEKKVVVIISFEGFCDTISVHEVPTTVLEYSSCLKTGNFCYYICLSLTKYSLFLKSWFSG